MRKNLALKQISPVILSASRATDIPGLYGDWFVKHLTKGYFVKRNPFNGTLSKVLTDRTELIVFWTKYAKSFMKHLNIIESIIPDYYFQFTLNDYDSVFEPGIPTFEERLENFKELSNRVGRERVIWRFDPLFLSTGLGVDQLIDRIYYVAERIHPFTDKLVISFIDIDPYLKVRRKLNQSAIKFRAFNNDEIIEFSERIRSLGELFNRGIATCGEAVDLSMYGIQKNKCIDDALISSSFSHNRNLQEYIHIKCNLKDRGQRKSCACIVSTDIGFYNTCTRQCIYCYANHSNASVLRHALKFMESDGDFDISNGF